MFQELTSLIEKLEARHERDFQVRLFNIKSVI